jgi:Zn-finger nucleic acid-binding protein
MELVASRGYFFCRYCGSFHFPETAGDDGVRILGDDERNLTCLVCAKPLAAALLDETHPIRFCKNCRGVLIARKGFAAVVERRRAWATNPPGPPVPLNRKDFDRKVVCPSCKRAMSTHPYYGPGNVVIDTCETCDLVWLDFGELRQIVNAPGKDRGSREMPPPSELSDPVPSARLVGTGLAADNDDGPDLLRFLFKLF